MNAAIVSAMVDYPIGELVAERVRAMGVRPFYKRFKHNGVNGPNIAAVYSDRGHGVRAPVVFYNRSNEAASLMKPGSTTEIPTPVPCRSCRAPCAKPRSPNFVAL